MTVHNIIGDGARIGGMAIQVGHLGNAPRLLPDARETASRLAGMAAESGPRLALTTAGEAKAVRRLLMLVSDTYPELAGVADDLAESLRTRLAEHR